jgi:hypothetical protein
MGQLQRLLLKERRSSMHRCEGDVDVSCPCRTEVEGDLGSWTAGGLRWRKRKRRRPATVRRIRLAIKTFQKLVERSLREKNKEREQKTCKTTFKLDSDLK